MEGHEMFGWMKWESCNPVTSLSDLEVEAGRCCHLLAMVDTNSFLKQQDPLTWHRCMTENNRSVTLQ